MVSKSSNNRVAKADRSFFFGNCCDDKSVQGVISNGRKAYANKQTKPNWIEESKLKESTQLPTQAERMLDREGCV